MSGWVTGRGYHVLLAPFILFIVRDSWLSKGFCVGDADLGSCWDAIFLLRGLMLLSLGSLALQPSRPLRCVSNFS